MIKNLSNLFRMKKLIVYILCLCAFFSIKIASGQSPCVGDVIRLGGVYPYQGYYLADTGSTSPVLLKLSAPTTQSCWVVQRSDQTSGTSLKSGTFPQLMNFATGRYLGGTENGVISMGGTTYGSGVFWTPVDINSNGTNINTLIATFFATRYPEQYTDVLYYGLSGKGTGVPVTDSSTNYTTIGNVPKISMAVYYDATIALVSNGGYILTSGNGSAPSYAQTTGTGTPPTNSWWFRFAAPWKYVSDMNNVMNSTINTTLLSQINALTAIINNLTYQGMPSFIKIDYPSITNGVGTYVYKFLLNTPVPTMTPTTIDIPTLTAFQSLLNNINLSNFLSSTEQGMIAYKTLFSFILDLYKATTPSALNSIVNNTTYQGMATNIPSGLTAPLITNLYDYPNVNFSVYTKIQSFFTNGLPNVSGQALTDLQTLSINKNLSMFLSSAEQATVTSLLSITKTQADFATALANAPTPGLLNTLISTGASPSTNVVYNTVSYLVDLPSATTGIFSIIQSFFAKGIPNVNGQALTDLQTLLGNTTLNKFLSSAEQTTIASLLKAVNTAESNVTAFVNALTAATSPGMLTPSAINTIINNSTYNGNGNGLPYLIDCPTASGSTIYTVIQSFFNLVNNVPNVTGQNLQDLKALLNNSNLKNFLNPSEQFTVKDLFIPQVNIAINEAGGTPTKPTLSIDQQVINALTTANKVTAIASKCTHLSSVIAKYKNSTVAATTSTYLFNIMGNLFTTINAYRSPMTSTQKLARNYCVKFFKAAVASTLLNKTQIIPNTNVTQVASTNDAIKILNAKK